MTVNVNHKETTLDNATNLTGLLQCMDIPEKGVALAVGNTVIPKTEWLSFTLTEGMNITLIKATQGG